MAVKVSQHQGVRFLALGGFAALVNWLVRFPLSLIMPFEAAVFVAYCIGMSVGFTLYPRYVFPGSDRPVTHQLAIFVAVNLAGAGVVLVVSYLLLQAQSAFPYPLFIKEGLAHGFAIGVGAVANFFGHKTLTFRVRPPEENGASSRV
ncbi:GtrA family protein [Methyloligella sp. GL2]|nr:GtrA family protein [Methyloligella sp. GL2]